MSEPDLKYHLYVVPSGPQKLAPIGPDAPRAKAASAAADAALMASTYLQNKAFEYAIRRRMETQEIATQINDELEYFPGCIISVVYDRWKIPYEGTKQYPRELRNIYVYGGADSIEDAISKFHLNGQGIYPQRSDHRWVTESFNVWVIDEIPYVPEHCKPLTPMDAFIRWWKPEDYKKRAPKECL